MVLKVLTQLPYMMGDWPGGFRRRAPHAVSLGAPEGDPNVACQILKNYDVACLLPMGK